MKTNFTDVAKKIANGTYDFIANPSGFMGATFGGFALCLLELNNINTLDPSAINLSQMEGVAVASGIGLLTAAFTKYATHKEQVAEKLDAENRVENESKERKYDAKMSEMGL